MTCRFEPGRCCSQYNSALFIFRFNNYKTSSVPCFSLWKLTAFNAYRISISDCSNCSGSINSKRDQVFSFGISDTICISQFNSNVTQILTVCLYFRVLSADSFICTGSPAVFNSETVTCFFLVKPTAFRVPG